MAGLVPAIHDLRDAGRLSCCAAAALLPDAACMDGRDKPGHDVFHVEFLVCSRHPPRMSVGMSTTAVYMMASRKHGTLYIGVTGQFIPRISQHREKLKPGFTSRYRVLRLVWFEMHEAIATAIQREKSLKKYRREWKINLIERDNPNWDDLYDGLFAPPPPSPYSPQDVMAGLVPAIHDLRDAD